mmetsp:Transcript_44878/g.91617  ORF Transcript_44878/g.91617 Transcript_44878/m.91617 type:complete len:261 (-) Transcript_44878:485-1267(-)
MHPGTCLNTPLLPPLRHASSNCVPLYLRFNLRCPVFALPFQLHSTKSTVSPFHPPSPSFPSSVQVKGSQSTCLLAAPSHQTAQRRQRRNTTKPPDSATSKTKCWMRETHQPMNSICMALSQLHSSFPDVLFGRPHRACPDRTGESQRCELDDEREERSHRHRSANFVEEGLHAVFARDAIILAAIAVEIPIATFLLGRGWLKRFPYAFSFESTQGMMVVDTINRVQANIALGGEEVIQRLPVEKLVVFFEKTVNRASNVC